MEGQGGTLLATRRDREVDRLQPESGRSKKGGAGTSACLRKLRGRSTTSLSNGPSGTDGPFAFEDGRTEGRKDKRTWLESSFLSSFLVPSFPNSVVPSFRPRQHVPVGHDDAVPIGIQMAPAGERH